MRMLAPFEGLIGTASVTIMHNKAMRKGNFMVEILLTTFKRDSLPLESRARVPFQVFKFFNLLLS